MRSVDGAPSLRSRQHGTVGTVLAETSTSRGECITATETRFFRVEAPAPTDGPTFPLRFITPFLFTMQMLPSETSSTSTPIAPLKKLALKHAVVLISLEVTRTLLAFLFRQPRAASWPSGQAEAAFRGQSRHPTSHDSKGSESCMDPLPCPATGPLPCASPPIDLLDLCSNERASQTHPTAEQQHSTPSRCASSSWRRA